MTDQELLKAYGEELGTHVNTPTVESLIGSHRFLRSEYHKTNEERQKEIQEIQKSALENARRQVNFSEYVSVESLKTMTLEQLVALIRGED